MPMLAVHMSIVQELIETLDIDELRENVGAALLGSTSPDRRVLTREERGDTHFFDLDTGGIGDGFRGMMDALPEMVSRSPADDWAVTAFLLGYVSHLDADEAWIVNVYRPFFGDGTELGDEPTKNILDRAMQYDLEVDIRGNQQQLTAWQEAIIASNSMVAGVPAQFIPPKTLQEWNAFVAGRVLTLPGTWDEFPRFISRYLDEPALNGVEIEGLIADPRGMLDHVYSHVPRDITRQHRAMAMEQSLAHAAEILA